jgi:hypothetical protein
VLSLTSPVLKEVYGLRVLIDYKKLFDWDKAHQQMKGEEFYEEEILEKNHLVILPDNDSCFCLAIN